MHAQTQELQNGKGGGVLDGGGLVGLALYAVTLALELAIGGVARWLAGALAASVAALFVALPVEPLALAWAAAVAPLAWSLAGALMPGSGLVWAWRLGARRPSREEMERVEDALAMLEGERAGRRWLATVRVLDEALPVALVRGRCMVLSRGTVEDRSLPAVLAHELGHVETLDARVTEALARLAVWDDPLGPSAEEIRATEMAEVWGDHQGRMLWGSLRWWLRLAGGAFSQRLLRSVWMAHWRRREYAADAYAVSLGQGEELARYLEERELPFERPPRRGIGAGEAHPPVALRIERLRTDDDEELAGG